MATLAYSRGSDYFDNKNNNYCTVAVRWSLGVIARGRALQGAVATVDDSQFQRQCVRAIGQLEIRLFSDRICENSTRLIDSNPPNETIAHNKLTLKSVALSEAVTTDSLAATAAAAAVVQINIANRAAVTTTTIDHVNTISERGKPDTKLFWANLLGDSRKETRAYQPTNCG